MPSSVKRAGQIATDGFRSIKALVYEPKADYEVKLKDFVAWLDCKSRSPREMIEDFLASASYCL